jgi:hypothetical protein
MALAFLASIGIGAAITSELVSRTADSAVDAYRDFKGEPILRFENVVEPTPEAPWALPDAWRGNESSLPQSIDDFAQFVQDYEGAEIGDSDYRLVVDNRRSGTVVITGMQIAIIEKSSPLNGTLFSGCIGGGPQQSLALIFDLDARNPVARSYPDGEPFFDLNYVELKQQETVVFDIIATAEKAAYEWRLSVDFIIDGEQHTQLVPPESEPPLRLTGQATDYHSAFQPGGDEAGNYWQQLPQGSQERGYC